MRNIAELPEVIPIFPLEGAVVLPRGLLPLQIFEPRYLAMLEDCLRTPERLIGMIQPRDVPDGQTERLQSIGCAGRVTAFTETDDGRYLITLTGISRFRCLEEMSSFMPWRRLRVDWTPFARDLGPPETDPGLDRPAFMALLRRYFHARELLSDWNVLEASDDEMLINTLSVLCPFESQDRQALLEAPSLSTRRETLVTLIEFALLSGDLPKEPLQ